MSHIKTFARIKPAEELYENYEIKGKKTFSLRVPELLRDCGLLASKSRSSTISYDFQFDRMFDTAGSQEEVYTVAAKEIVTGFLDGYNGTIFAYGQTGTGKTYTVEGSARRYSERGLAPRALAEIYKSLEQRENEDITLHISYLEIYQEVAYDLLSTSARTASPVTVFPRVNVVEGANGTCMIRNLSVHLAPSEDVAHALLLQGQANRRVAETPVNQRSSRSHAVFTIYLTAKKQQSDIITRSKLHLVDLAGSERVAKTGVDGQQLTEAKSINLSLHHLETVIIALQADSAQNRPRSTNSGSRSINTSHSGRPSSADGVRRHVPYRNSLLTMVLRDSLGGNCLTSMIATISLEIHNLGETLSTCRFAQRVACISNHARRNEEIDDKTLIQQLKRRIAELESQMACLRLAQAGEGDRGEEEDSSSKLTDEDKLSCAQVVQEYLAGRIADPVTAGITNPFKFRECLRILKKMVMNKYFQNRLSPNNQLPANSASSTLSAGHTDSRGGAATNRRADNDGGVVEVHGNAQILRLDDAQPLGESPGTTSAQPGVNGAVDTDELILNIQRLYAATCRDQRVRQQGPQSDYPTTPPRTAVHREPYKSPFERKREKEIKRLARRLDMMKKTQSSQDQHLQMMRASTAFGELSSTESIIRNKIQVTREQIADQHAYLLHLRHTEANPEILQQEKLVEDQLIKREAKFQKKLDEVLQKKAELEAQAVQGEGLEGKDRGDQGQTTANEKRSLEEQFSHYKKRNGMLNTRQVFEMLKSEEKKQTKVTQHAETEKKFLMTKQLALKEEATREKLRELKEMLRRSREEALLGPEEGPANQGYALLQAFSSGGGNSHLFLDQSGTAASQLPFGAGNREDTKVTDLTGQSWDQTFSVERSGGGSAPAHSNVEDLETSMTRGDDGEKNRSENDMRKTGSGLSSKVTPQGPQHQSSSNTLSRSSSRVELKWDSAYSRPSTAHSTRSQELVDPQQQTHGSSSIHSMQHVSSAGNAGSSSGAIRCSREGSKGPSGRLNANSNSSGQTSNANIMSSEPTLSLLHENDDGHKAFVNVDGLHDHNRGDFQSGKALLDEVACEDYSPTVMPSEYIHGMDNKDKFDARKMGLSSKTFDSALTSMLSDDPKMVSYGFEFYDKFARASKPPVKKGAASRSSERRTPTASHRSPERRTTATTDLPAGHTGKFATAWGPEAKNFSVAQRLAQFLSDDKESRSTHPVLETNSSAKSVSFLERLTQLQDEEQAEGAEVKSPRIQALQDRQREMTYMGRVQAERERVAKIRQARDAAEAIQRAWRRHCRTST